MLTSLYIFPSHEHEFTGFLLCAHLLTSLERHKEAQFLCWRSLMAQPQRKLEIYGKGMVPVFWPPRWLQWKATASQYPERQRSRYFRPRVVLSGGCGKNT